MDSEIANMISSVPYRMAFAGGWIDQPFVSRHNPSPPGSMVVVSIEPQFRFMDRAGFATGTRKVAVRLWGGRLPNRPPADLVRELYKGENGEHPEPSGSQDMIGLIYPGVSRLDYDFAYEEGLFPKHIESNNDPLLARWIERVINVLPVEPRPAGYNPLGVKNLDPKWIARLGETGKKCYDAILRQDVRDLGASMNECMECWEAVLPNTVRHPALTVDLPALLRCYQDRYPGAMYSGCGGGYLYVVSEDQVPGAFHAKVRVSGN